MSSRSFLSLSPEEVGLAAPLCDDIVWLDGMLGDVLCDQEGDGLVALARRLCANDEEDPRGLIARLPELQDPLVVQKVLRAFTVLFQLLNTAEQKEIVRVNRGRVAGDDGATRPDSIAEAIAAIKRSGAGAADVQALMDRMDIQPTITAHPTEARRRAVLDKLQAIAEALVERGQTPTFPLLDQPLDNRSRAERMLQRSLTALWQTSELHSSPMTVDDEVRNALYFFEHTILTVVPWLHDDLRNALARSYPGETFDIPPFLSYRSWVGGDRDGNPNVTPEVTWRTILTHKELSLRFYIRQVDALRMELTESQSLVRASDELVGSLALDENAGLISVDAQRRHATEPYALKLTAVGARLEASLAHLAVQSDFRAEGPGFAAKPPAYSGANEFLDDLRLIESSLRQHHGAVLAEGGLLHHLLIQVRTFGFHLASLDIRQHSREHEIVIDEMFAESGVSTLGKRYAELSESEKVRVLTRELLKSRPLLPREWQCSDKARAVLETLDVVRNAQRYVGPSAVKSYVISMTHGASDVLEVLLLMREMGMYHWRNTDAGPVLESGLDVVPLFETIEDLDNCDTLMRRLFANKVYQAQVAARSGCQEIMLGYSDSSKDGGYLAANWALQETQAKLAAVCRQADITLRLFHGRGGTVGRGGGRANRAILSQPGGSFNGRIRFTEQGEVSSFRYSLAPIAHRHLEQIVNAVFIAAAPQRSQPRERTTWKDAMGAMAEESRRVYRALVLDDAEFWDFYTQATPIHHISRLPIASRPSFRPGMRASGLDDLRAIPWVFAWVQSRYVLPGWYGIGSGLEWFAAQEPGNEALLREMYAKWPFFQTVIDNAQLELVRTHLPTAAWYASRVSPAALGTRFHTRIEEEYSRATKAILSVTGSADLLPKSVVRRTIALRNPAVTPLSKLQVALLEHWPSVSEADAEIRNAWRDAILMSITGIAAAMQSTG